MTEVDFFDPSTITAAPDDEEIDWDFDRDVAYREGLLHSRRLDVHRWSDHPEVNPFVDKIYDLLVSSGNASIRKRHLKVLLLDLYVNWCEDPHLKTSVSRDSNKYEPGSIYNELNISKTTILIVDLLLEQGFLEQANGVYYKETGKGFQSRIWPTPKLNKYFSETLFSTFDIGYSLDRLAVILRDQDKNNVEYAQTDETRSMQEELNSYNLLLQRTFVSIPSLEKGTYIDPGGDSLSFATQSGKFTRRIFNNSSFEMGGRFTGGFWQNCPRAYRDQILINDDITVEIDYGSLHPNLLYARDGLDIWQELGDDPYRIGPISFEQEPEKLRKIAKSLLLIMLNVDGRDTIPAAFRSGRKTGDPLKKLVNEQVFEAVSVIEQRFHPIAAYFSSGIGLKLQNKDSKIASIAINHFTAKNEPILSVHDSFIVRQGWEDELELVMDAAFKTVTNSGFSSRRKYAGRTYEDVLAELNANYAIRRGRGNEIEEEQDLKLYREISPKRSDWYKTNLAQFREWLNQTEG